MPVRCIWLIITSAVGGAAGAYLGYVSNDWPGAVSVGAAAFAFSASGSAYLAAQSNWRDLRQRIGRFVEIQEEVYGPGFALTWHVLAGLIGGGEPRLRVYVYCQNRAPFAYRVYRLQGRIHTLSGPQAIPVDQSCSLQIPAQSDFVQVVQFSVLLPPNVRGYLSSGVELRGWTVSVSSRRSDDNETAYIRQPYLYVSP